MEVQQNFVKDVFFLVYQADGKVIYDQLVEQTKNDLPVGMTVVNIGATVSNDFHVKCFKQG